MGDVVANEEEAIGVVNVAVGSGLPITTKGLTYAGRYGRGI